MSPRSESESPSSKPVRSAWAMVEEAKRDLENLSVEQLESEIQAGDSIVVDIRDHRELYLEGKIPGAVHAPRGMLEFWIDPASEYHREVFEPSKRYVLYCAGGGRSALAAKAMRDMGYPDVAHLEPGFGGWAAAGLEIEDVRAKSKWVPKPD